jgi:type IV pilus assembly protein PilX
VVLIIALILLVVISLLAVTSMRNAGSAESVAGNVRTTELATQAAEIALRHCESAAIQVAKKTTDTSDPTYYDTEFPVASIWPIASTQWQSTSTWDTATTSSTTTYALPTAKFTISTGTTYKRAPECMVELLSGGMPDGVASVTPSAFVITVRGFGPEVAAVTGAAPRIRPVGTEVWLQSTIEIE